MLALWVVLFLVSSTIREEFRKGQSIYVYMIVIYVIITFIVTRNNKKWGVFCVYPLPLMLSLTQYLYTKADLEKGISFDNLLLFNYILSIWPIACLNYNKYMFNLIV
jgi:hypothetical protein